MTLLDMDGWIAVYNQFNSVSVISSQWWVILKVVPNGTLFSVKIVSASYRIQTLTVNMLAGQPTNLPRILTLLEHVDNEPSLCWKKGPADF